MSELNARIPLRDETRAHLREMKREGETYDDLLCRITDYSEGREHEREQTHG